jgi:hypothetical protein
MDATARETSAFGADGEVVWSWRPDADAKWATMRTHRADDGGKKARSPGRARHKCVPWKGTVLERVQVPSGKGRSGR